MQEIRAITNSSSWDAYNERECTAEELEAALGGDWFELARSYPFTAPDYEGDVKMIELLEKFVGIDVSGRSATTVSAKETRSVTIVDPAAGIEGRTMTEAGDGLTPLQRAAERARARSARAQTGGGDSGLQRKLTSVEEQNGELTRKSTMFAESGEQAGRNRIFTKGPIS